MEKLNDVINNQYGKSDYRLEAEYQKNYDEDMTFRKIANDLKLPTKTLMKYTYILLDNGNSFCGFINILRSDKNKINAEIEIGIKPELQGRGLGTKVTEAFYDQLFGVGYASVTSSVFGFNEASRKMHEKIAGFNGVRIGAYYINGELWPIYIFTTVNPKIIAASPKQKIIISNS